MTLDQVALAVTAGTGALAALGAGLYRIARDRRADRAAELDRVRTDALARARNEALIREATAMAGQLKTEAGQQDAVIADLTARNAQLRGMLDRLSRGEGLS